MWITESNAAEWEQFCSKLDACEDIPLPKESLEFESVDGNDGMARWRAWIVRDEKRRLLTEAVVEDGSIKALLPTTVSRGCLGPPPSRYLQTWHWGELIHVWTVHVESGSTNGFDVVSPLGQDVERMDLGRLAGVTRRFEQRSRYWGGYYHRTAFAVMVHQGVGVKAVEDLLQGLWQIDKKIAVLPKFWSPPAVKDALNREYP
ncbi:MAG: hypothetical protein KJ579_01265 [Verrucomicrobia bacterium]|nr:hypothetical protein [Verrucomicrobiota bacterium]